MSILRSSRRDFDSAERTRQKTPTQDARAGRAARGAGHMVKIKDKIWLLLVLDGLVLTAIRSYTNYRRFWKSAGNFLDYGLFIFAV